MGRNITNPRSKVLGKMAASGIKSTKEGNIFKLTPLISAASIKKAAYKLPGPAILFGYVEASNPAKSIIDEFTGEPFTRVRDLSDDSSRFGASNSAKYLQHPGTRPHAYFPADKRWSKVLQNPKTPIIITEGELKSICSMINFADSPGLFTIGLGGVASWRSRKHNMTMLPELEAVVWQDRAVFICFDSDATTNHNVQREVNLLAAELVGRGAEVSIVELPNTEDGDKQGLDDFVMAEGPRAFLDLINESEEFAGHGLADINAKYVFVESIGRIMKTQYSKSDVGIKPRDFPFYTASYAEVPVTVGKTVKYINAGEYWVKWSSRNTVSELQFTPGGEAYIEKDDGSLVLNTWLGWGTTPNSQSPKPFVDYLKRIVPDPEQRGWLLSWLAYPIQNPGAKLSSAVVLYSPTHGTGKSTMGAILNEIYGEAFSPVSADQVVGERQSNNEWADGAQLVFGDDFSPAATGKQGELRKIITSDKIRLRRKYMPDTVIKDHANYLFTTNHKNSFQLDETDRRFFICEVQGERDEDFYEGFYEWMRSGGADAIHGYLLSINLDGFNPAGVPPTTEAKKEFIEIGRYDLPRWLNEIDADPDQIGSSSSRRARDFYSADELRDIYAGRFDARITTREVVLAIDGLRLRVVRAGVGGRKYYCVKNREAWGLKPDADCKEHIKSTVNSHD